MHLVYGRNLSRDRIDIEKFTNWLQKKIWSIWKLIKSGERKFDFLSINCIPTISKENEKWFCLFFTYSTANLWNILLVTFGTFHYSLKRDNSFSLMLIWYWNDIFIPFVVERVRDLMAKNVFALIHSHCYLVSKGKFNLW